MVRMGGRIRRWSAPTSPVRCSVARMTAMAARRCAAEARIIANMGVGYVESMPACGCGVVVTNTPDVADRRWPTALGLLINAVREVPAAEQWLRQALGEARGLSADRGATLRGTSRRHFGMGQSARHHQAWKPSASPSPTTTGAQVDGCAYHPTLIGLAHAVDADFGRAGRCGDRNGRQCRSARGTRAAAACSSISGAAAPSTSADRSACQEERDPRRRARRVCPRAACTAER